MAAAPPKYCFQNGRMVLNPAFQQQQPQQPAPTVANPQRALACAYNLDDTAEAASTTGLPIPESLQQTFMKIQSPAYVAAFGCGNRVDGGQLLGDLSQVFGTHQVPIGLSGKLLELQSYAMHFKIDDSGSMNMQCSNGRTRWQNAEARMHILMDLIQFVPTGPIRLSFLNRSQELVMIRRNETPGEFAAVAHRTIQQAFMTPPHGGTPIYRNVYNMLKNTGGQKTALYLVTDGEPNGYGGSVEDREREIADTTNAIIGRRNPRDHPVTLLCCSENPIDTMWMHEIEEMACRPGRPGYVAAQQNFQAERTEVLNDQGPEFPYSYAMWLLCNLVAALNPNDLDALDQHAPLTKPTMETLLGRTLSEVEYLSYFNQHPNARWVFWEDYAAFFTTPYAAMIPSVNLFDTTLADRLAMDIQRGDDNSENRELGYTEEFVLTRFGRQRPANIRAARADYWQNHYLRMEQSQSTSASQDLWSDYLAWRNLGGVWGGFQQQQQQQMTPAVGMPQQQQQQPQIRAPMPYQQQPAPMVYPQGAPGGYPQAAPGGYPQQQQPAGYPPVAPGGYPQQQQQPAYPPQQQQPAPGGYPQAAPVGYPPGTPGGYPPQQQQQQQAPPPYPGQPGAPSAPPAPSYAQQAPPYPYQQVGMYGR